MNGKGFEKMFRTVGPLVAMAAIGSAMAAGRKNGKFDFDWGNLDLGPDCDPGKGFRKGFGGGFGAGFGGHAGVPLADLDMDGDMPNALVLGGADNVVLTHGDDFSIAIQGEDEAKDALRFRLHNGTLHIASDNTSHGGEGMATVNVIMPAPGKITIAGAGNVNATELALDRLDVSIAGAGKLTADGTVRALGLRIAGSGSAKLGELMVEEAEVTIAGAGNAVFACDGEVEARLMGSGNVTVRGSARCRVHAMGSGYLVCEPRDRAAAPDESAAEDKPASKRVDKKKRKGGKKPD